MPTLFCPFPVRGVLGTNTSPFFALFRWRASRAPRIGMGEAARSARHMVVPNELSTVKDTERSLMAATNINRVVMTGNLTSAPELRTRPGGTGFGDTRRASNPRRKDQDSGDWVD